MQDLNATMHGAELAFLAMGLRAVLARARESEPDVVSLAITVTPDAIPGLDTIEAEYHDRAGHAIGGFGL